MSGRVQDKVVVVTGAARGIGRGCAELLAREGARVVIGDVLDGEGEDAAAAIRAAGGEALYQRADVTDEGACAALAARAVGAYGRLDALVNVAGWFPRATLEDTTTELWESIMAVNLRGPFYCCKHAAPHLRRAGGGSIVNIGSINGIQGLPNLVAYASAKGGLLALTRTLAGAYAHERIRANYVIPGWVLSEGEMALHQGRGTTAEELRRAGEVLPLGRHQTPGDTAYAVLYLVSDESAQVTGTVMHIDAGASTLPIQPGAPYVG
jgi:NAD(P)-dependent dehydrogenase (short-subunit alcohol dehydrogenase family)